MILTVSGVIKVALHQTNPEAAGLLKEISHSATDVERLATWRTIVATDGTCDAGHATVLDTSRSSATNTDPNPEARTTNRTVAMNARPHWGRTPPLLTSRIR